MGARDGKKEADGDKNGETGSMTENKENCWCAWTSSSIYKYNNSFDFSWPSRPGDNPLS